MSPTTVFFLLQRTIFVVLIFILFFQKIKQRRVEKTIDAPVKRRDSTFPPTKEEERGKKTLGERRCSFEFQKKKKWIFISGLTAPAPSFSRRA